MARTCIFCEGLPVTNAHVFREGWMDQVFPGAESFRHHHVRHGEDGFDNSWEKASSDFKVKCVCATCNSGWMDRLDHAAEALFLTQAAAIGSPVKLTRQADMELLARWCILVAVLFDQTQASPVLGPETHRVLAEGGVPESASVWLLRTVPPEWEVTGWAAPLEWVLERESGATDHAYFISFGVKHLVAQVYLAEGGIALLFDRAANGPILRQLWPPTLTPFLWPPPENVRWDDLKHLNSTFDRPA